MYMWFASFDGISWNTSVCFTVVISMFEFLGMSDSLTEFHTICHHFAEASRLDGAYWYDWCLGKSIQASGLNWWSCAGFSWISHLTAKTKIKCIPILEWIVNMFTLPQRCYGWLRSAGESAVILVTNNMVTHMNSISSQNRVRIHPIGSPAFHYIMR